MADDTATEVADLKRSLNLYRVLLVVAVVAYVWTVRSMTGTYQVGEFGAAAQVWTVDLAARYAFVNQDKAHLADFSETYFSSPGASVHGHFMGHGQITPLHLHPDSYEATVIAGGSAVIDNYWGEDGVITHRSATYGLGSVVSSPPLDAHEWRNPDDTRFLANLVFTQPKFSGNFYVKPDDPRILGGGAPYAGHPADDLPAFAASGDAHALTPVAMDGHLYELLLRDRFTVPANLSHPVVGYVFAGQGTVRDQPLREQVLVHLENDTEMVIEASPGAPLAMVLFDPYGALDAVR